MVHLILLDHLPTDLAAVIDDGVHFSPCAELSLPVGDGGERGDDEEGSSQTHEENLIEKRDGLDGLPQPHLISQNTVFPTSRQTFSGVEEFINHVRFDAVLAIFLLYETVIIITIHIFLDSYFYWVTLWD